ncbi:NAD(P)-dependent oxidoreductase [Halomonas sp. V046]|uniref:NAD(P)-dependent oxidoreductase n=1 Tax=Halomonas sp. V046 TaxID=3459611 RepID=UPI004044B538
MKMIIFGATGDVGRAVTAEALQRNVNVTAVSRQATDDARLPNAIARRNLDVLATSAEQIAELLAEHDVAISALRPPAGQESDLVALTQRIMQAARLARTRMLITGGAALLKLADNSGHSVLTAPGFLPDQVRPIAEACAAQDALLDDFEDCAWTCLRPPAMLTQGDRTGEYTLGSDTLVTDANGASQISYADFAVAMLDLTGALDAPRRVTAAWT